MLSLYYTHNNAFDSILLCCDGIVVSRWDAEPEHVRAYIKDYEDLSIWDVQDRDGIMVQDADGTERPGVVADYGDEMDRDDVIAKWGTP